MAEIWDVVRKDLVDTLDATDIWFEPADTFSAAAALPQVAASGFVGGRVYRWVGTGFALPKEGVQLRVGCEGAPHGRVVLRGDARHAVDIDDRLFALTLMELLAIAIAQSPGESLADLAPMPAHPKAVND